MEKLTKEGKVVVMVPELNRIIQRKDLKTLSEDLLTGRRFRGYIKHDRS